ncbi:S-adenosyl-L-methionine-dependent methyltransferase, partial [Thozetella sp. PMI_491]
PRQLGDIAAWNIFIHWKAFDHIPLQGSISYKDLADKLAADEGLISRIGGMLVASGKLMESEPGFVSHSRLSPMYRSEHPASSLNWVAVANGMRPYVFWPEYFEKYGRREPRGATHTPCSLSWGQPEKAVWEIIASDPEYSKNFAEGMKAKQIAGGNMKMTGPEALYDMGWLAEAAARSPQPSTLLVDVGGGHGQLLKDILGEMPSVPAQRCVLQDRPEVVDGAIVAGDLALREVVKMGHDFHTEQPVKGALVYFLRRVLLDYSDELAVGILSHLAEALPDDPNARVLVMEELLLDPPTPKNRIVDLVMMNLGGKLRNRAMYERTVAASGLRMVNFHTKPGSPMCVVECARA